MKHILQMLLIFFILTLFLFVHSKVYGQTTTSINATIKISVCGNNVAEGGEDCDGTDLHGKTCISLGYGSGTLGCDISCSYNTSACVVLTPTPIPTSTSIISSELATPTPISSLQPVIVIPTASPTSQPIISNLISSQSTLPQTLRIFDLNGDGRIDISQLHTVLALWVNAWKQYLSEVSLNNNQTNTKICDVNHDGSCGLDDFSILLYYVGR